MSKTIIVLSFCFLCLDGLNAQQATPYTRIKFHFLNQVGLLQGESTSAFHLQSINGIQYKNWFTGIGCALDYYRFKTIPLFIDIRKYMGKEKNAFFLYADGGIHFTWEKEEKNFNYTTTYSPGFYSNAGLGYKAGLKNGMAFVLNAGYTYKRISETQQQTVCPFSGPCYVQVDKYHYDLNRLIIQIGWMF